MYVFNFGSKNVKVHALFRLGFISWTTLFLWKMQEIYGGKNMVLSFLCNDFDALVSRIGYVQDREYSSMFVGFELQACSNVFFMFLVWRNKLYYYFYISYFRQRSYVVFLLIFSNENMSKNMSCFLSFYLYIWYIFHFYLLNYAIGEWRHAQSILRLKLQDWI